MKVGSIVHTPFEFTIPFPGTNGLPITGFGLAVLAAFLIGQVVSERELYRRGHLKEAAQTGDVLLAGMLGTIIGAKLYYQFVILQSFDLRDLFSRGGFVYWGGFIGSVVAGTILVRMKKLSFWRYADVAGIAISAGYAVGRTGCWAVGDDYGKPWDGPLAVAFPRGAPPSTAGVMSSEFGVQFPPGTDPATVVSVYPTQLMEVAMGFVMFLIAWRLRAHKHALGWLLGLYCLMAGIERLIVEFFRAKDDHFFAAVPLTLAQLIAIGIAVVGVAIMVALNKPRAGEQVPVTA